MNYRAKIVLRYLFVVLLGVFLHFSYQLSGHNTIVGLIAPVNESVWEHLKLLFFPMLILTIWDLSRRDRNCLYTLPARTIGILWGMFLIVSLHYTITGIIGAIITWIDIVIFLLAIAFAFWLENKLCRYGVKLSVVSSLIILLIFIILFVVFTFAPPALGIFME